MNEVPHSYYNVVMVFKCLKINDDPVRNLSSKVICWDTKEKKPFPKIHMGGHKHINLCSFEF